MRKAIMSITLAATLLVAVLFPGCETISPGDATSKEVSEEVITEEKEFSNFTYVDVEGTFEVEITRSDLFSTTISADADFFEYVAVSKKGDTLKIYLNPRHTFTDFTLQAKTLKAEITMPALYGVSLVGASKGTITGFKSSKDFSLELSGASSLDMKDIEVGDAEFEVSGASKVGGNMTADDAKFDVSGASGVELTGSANNIVLDVSGASKVDLGNCPLNDADVKLSGASEATIHAKGRLDCDLSAASRLYFYGNPSMGNISVTGASTVKHK